MEQAEKVVRAYFGARTGGKVRYMAPYGYKTGVESAGDGYEAWAVLRFEEAMNGYKPTLRKQIVNLLEQKFWDVVDFKTFGEFQYIAEHAVEGALRRIERCCSSMPFRELAL